MPKLGGSSIWMAAVPEEEKRTNRKELIKTETGEEKLLWAKRKTWVLM